VNRFEVHMARLVSIAVLIELVLAAVAYGTRNVAVLGEALLYLQYPGVLLLWVLPDSTPKVIAFATVLALQAALWCAILVLSRRIERGARPA